MLLLSLFLTGLGVVTFFLVVGAHPARAWQTCHVNLVYWTALAQGGLVLAAIWRVTKAEWSRELERIPETLSAFLPVSLAGFLVLWFWGRSQLFPWLHEPVPAKAWWLKPQFLFWRDLGGFLLLLGLDLTFLRISLRPDFLARQRPGDPEKARVQAYQRLGVVAPALILAYCFVMSLWAIDLIMSLSPRFLSTLFGGIYFWSGLLSATSTTALLMLALRKRLGLEDYLTPKHLHDLGKLVFAFSVFWAYLFFAQYLVIWYGNLPEETEFLFLRFHNPWLPLMVAVLSLVFGLPFLGLLGVTPKKTPLTLGLFSTCSVVGLWGYQYLMITPSLSHDAPQLPLGGPELGITLGFLGLFSFAVSLFLRRVPILPTRASLTSPSSPPP